MDRFPFTTRPRIGRMSHALMAGTFGWLLLGSPQAQANPEQLQQLLQRNNCTACHLIDKRKYGPNMLEVAAKYKGDSAAAGKLAKKIKEGGSGVWGEDIMPPQPLVREPDLKAMVELILALKP